MIIEELIAMLGFELKGTDELERFNEGIAEAESVLGRFAKTAVIFAASVGVISAGLLGELGKGAIETGIEFENLASTLTTIEGSSDKAKKSLDWIQDFATKTPYNITQVADAFVKLKAYGLDPTAGLLESVGNASSAMGKGLDQGVEAIADAVRGESERLKEFGIVGTKKGQQMTYSWTENGKSMKKVVKNDAIEIQNALVGIFNERFPNAMARQALTLQGIMSNLGDQFTNFKRKVADAGFFDWVKKQFSGFADLLDGLNKSGVMNRLAEQISITLIQSGEGFRQFFASFTVQDVAAFVQGFITIISILGQFVLAVGKLILWVGNLVKSLLGLRATWQGLAVLGGIALAIFAPVVATLAATVLAVDDFIAWWQGRPSLIGSTIDKIKSYFPGLTRAIERAWSATLSVLQNNPITSALEAFKARIDTLDIGGSFERIKASLGNFWDSLKTFGQGIVDVAEALSRLVTSGGNFDAWAKPVGAFFADLVKVDLTGVRAAIDILAESFRGLGVALTDASKGDFAGAWDAIKTAVVNNVGTIKTAIAEMIATLHINTADFSGVWDAVVAYLDTVATRIGKIFDTLAKIIQHFKDSLKFELPDFLKSSDGTTTVSRNLGQQLQGKRPDAPPADPTAPIPDNEFSFRGIWRDLMRPVPGAAATLSQATGGASGAAANTVANDNRTSNVTSSVSAPVTISVTTNASPDAIGAAAGGAVRNAGEQINRNIAVTAVPGGMAR